MGPGEAEVTDVTVEAESRGGSLVSCSVHTRLKPR